MAEPVGGMRFKQLAPVGQKFYALTEDGRVYAFNGECWTAVSMLSEDEWRDRVRAQAAKK